MLQGISPLPAAVLGLAALCSLWLPHLTSPSLNSEKEQEPLYREREQEPLYNELRERLKGEVYLPGQEEYERRRQVHNGLCDNRPEVLVVPHSQGDVQEAVVWAGKQGVELSIRSGGHSYTCTSSKVGGLHLDLRALATVNLVETSESPTGWAAQLGPGATWAQVLEVIKPSEYTLVHGQCLSVGVGGYLLGGGVNIVGTTARHGAGMQNVLKYDMVTADGSKVQVTPEGASVTAYESQSTTWANFTPGTDLYFGLRGAGGSLGVVTRFLYTVYPHPETKAAVFLVHISGVEDLLVIEKIARRAKHFQFGLYNNYFPVQEVRPRLGVLWARRWLLSLLSWLQGEQGEALVLTVTDIRPSAGLYTDVPEVLQLLLQEEVRLAISSPRLLDAISRQVGWLVMQDYEAEYLTPEEVEASGRPAVVSANLGGLASVEALAGTILEDPMFGVATKYSQEALAAGCDFCFLAINFNTVPTPPPEERICLTERVGALQAELTCTYRPGAASSCPTRVRETRDRLLNSSLERGGTDSQYVNTPSCQAGSFRDRYWGSHYQQLAAVKAAWDPGNTFHYCHSVGSLEEQCCPKDK